MASIFGMPPGALNDALYRALPLLVEARRDGGEGEVLDYRERVDIMVGTLRKMSPLRREILLRRQIDEAPIAVIAADLGLRIAVVEWHCSRALAALHAARGRPSRVR